MAKKKTPDVGKVVDLVMQYVEDTMNFLKNTPPEERNKKEVVALEDAMNDKFASLLPQEQAHMLFFAIMIISKLARLKPQRGRTFSNSILMAQTFTVVMDAAVSKLKMDIIDIAFSVENDPTYDMQDGDLERMMLDMKGLNLDKLDPQGNA